jgi:hypothetical protein
MVVLCPSRPVEQFTAAVGAAIIERLGTFGAKGAFERTDEGAGGLSQQVHAAFFAIGAHFKHRLPP